MVCVRLTTPWHPTKTVRPFHPEPKGVGTRPTGVERAPRIHFLQSGIGSIFRVRPSGKHCMDPWRCTGSRGPISARSRHRIKPPSESPAISWSGSKRVHSVVPVPANVHDSRVLPDRSSARRRGGAGEARPVRAGRPCSRKQRQQRGISPGRRGRTIGSPDLQ